MSVATQVAPIRIGVLIDSVMLEPSHWHIREDFLRATQITFDDATASGMLDRPVELVIREAIDERFRVPAISWCGADDWHGQWTFSLSNGSLTDEPYVMPIYAHDVARCFAVALSRAEPLSPRGVMEALERVKMLPAACGEPGTRISFGKWTRRGWVGAGYLVAREVTPDLRGSVLRGRLALPEAGRR
jgi:hypothetical protein